MRIRASSYVSLVTHSGQKHFCELTRGAWYSLLLRLLMKSVIAKNPSSPRLGFDQSECIDINDSMQLMSPSHIYASKGNIIIQLRFPARLCSSYSYYC